MTGCEPEKLSAIVIEKRLSFVTSSLLYSGGYASAERILSSIFL